MTTSQIINVVLNIGAIAVMCWYFSGPLRRKLGWTSLTERQVQKHREAIERHEVTIREVAAKLQQHVQNQIEDLDHVLLITEDLIRLQPERAETLELSLVELRRSREYLSQGRDLFAIEQLPTLRAAVGIWKWRKKNDGR